MEKVTGIGGVFFRANDPDGLAAWYETHLGVTGPAQPWRPAAGVTIFAPFAGDTDYFPAQKQWMLNFRVADLTTMIAQLEVAGITVETRPEWDSEIGRFARIHDPEGNPVELWEPGAGSVA